MTIAKMLNLGSGRTKFPGPRPDHHGLVPEGIYSWPKWLNISRNASEEPDCVMDLFTYPWPLESNTYEGALLSHLAEHVSHDINVHEPDPCKYGDDDASLIAYMRDFKRSQAVKQELKAKYQDGHYAFWSELYRVLKPGAMVHILSPHAYSHGANFDPSHTRYLLPDTFTHSMKPDENAPFEYAASLHFEMRDYRPALSHRFAHLVPLATDSPEVQQAKNAMLMEAIETRIGVITEFYVKLEAIK